VCELETNRKKIEESEGRIAKRTEFPELKKNHPRFDLAPGPRVEPPVPRLRWVSSERPKKMIYSMVLSRKQGNFSSRKPHPVSSSPRDRARDVSSGELDSRVNSPKSEGLITKK
jgi:hypothetical protein